MTTGELLITILIGLALTALMLFLFGIVFDMEWPLKATLAILIVVLALLLAGVYIKTDFPVVWNAPL